LATEWLQWAGSVSRLNLKTGRSGASTSWLFKYRLRSCPPPRVASDTTRGLDRLARLEALRRPAASTLLPVQDVLDLRASLA
jgi:hypothetical protein